MHSTKRLIAAGLAALLLLSAFGCTKKAQNAGASLPASTAGAIESTSLTELSSEGTSVSTTLPPSSTTQKATVTKKNINTHGNKITDDPKYIGDLDKREEEDPQYKPKPDTKPIPSTPDTLTTSPSTTKRQTTTKRPTTTVKPTSGNSSTTTTAPSTTTAPPVSGWHTAGGKTYFYNNGKPVTGWQSLNGLRYYFDNSGVLSSKVGLDVSEWNETIDWPKVKAAGVDFVMIRVGFRGWGKAGTIRLDAMFKKHLQGASQAGLECGVYFFTQAITPAEARQEANFVLAAIEGFTLTYPIAFDIEDSGSSQGRTNLAKLTNQQRTDICIAFSDTIKKAGYYPSIYANYNWLTNKLQASRLVSYDIWLALYTSALKPDYSGAYKMWQHTRTGKVNGVKGNVDCNVSLRDYADYLKRNGWNHL